MKGPALRAVLELNPSALEQAAQLDIERKTKGARGPLHGIPVLVKDKIVTIASEGRPSRVLFLVNLLNANLGERPEHNGRVLFFAEIHRSRGRGGD